VPIQLRRASKDVERPDYRLAFLDQASFLTSRATGRGQLIQCVWIYEHAVDFDALKRFHRDFGYGLFGRRIERSPLPFGRHRWVSSLGPATEMDIAEIARPRAEVSDWADERSLLPVDPELGPGWHLGVLPLTDGATAISLVASHCLGDGIGAILAIVDAVNGNRRDFGYLPPRSRTRLRAVATDARETVQGVPEVARTLVAAAKLVVRRRPDRPEPTATRPASGSATADDRNVVVPAIAIFIDVDEWDACAKARGGNSFSLVAGFAAKLGERMGRRRADNGTVTLLIAMNDRAADGDTRANALLLAHVSVDPTDVTTDLSGARAAIRQGIETVRDEPDEAFEHLALTPFTPKRAVKHLADGVFGFGDPLVSCSNVGDVDPAVGRADGTDAEYVFIRGVDQNVSRQDMERGGGHLMVASARLNGRIFITVVGYQAGEENSKPRLRELAARTLAEFDLTGSIY
jgi:hypothetical protein